MDKIIHHLTLDTFVSDPLLLIGAALFIIGIIVFFVSVVKFFTTHEPVTFTVPVEDVISDEHAEPQEEAAEPLTQVIPEENNDRSDNPTTATVQSAPVAVKSDETVVLTENNQDIQTQIHIIVAQLKQINKKMLDFEHAIEDIYKQADDKLEPNELKEAPMDPKDFTQKLLKLAEHVIALEKEMAKIKSSSKAPVMPL